MITSSRFKSTVLLVAAFSHFQTVLITQAIGQTVAPTALPAGGAVRAGAAAISQGGTAANPDLTVNQTSHRAVIEWSSFNIGSSSAVQFNQPDATSSTLNRVLDTNASQIFGRLTSNGQIFLINPNGVIFGATASVDVGGLVATTHALSNEDYMAGKTTFDRNGATGQIVNDGKLTSRLGGYIALLAPELRNNGVIVARAGTVALAAGDKITLNFDPDARLTNVLASPSTVQALIDNKKIVAAPDGQVIVSAQAFNELTDAAIRNSGTISAGSIKKSGGRIFLDTSGTLTNSGTIKANSKTADGGSVTLKGKLVSNTGTISANGGTNGVTNGMVTDPTVAGQGGNVTLLGDQVGLFGGSFVSATGMNGGGTVLVGGDWQGGNGVPQSRQVLMVTDARIDASALNTGHGGKVVLWSTEWTGFYGSIKATGGSQGGNGGMVETSSHGKLQAMGTLDVTAPNGQGGQWLIDPADIYIVAVAGHSNANSQNSAGSFTAVNSSLDSTITDSTINTQLDSGTNVTVTSTRDLYLQAGASLNQQFNSGAVRTLKLEAARTLYTDATASISGVSSKINLVLKAEKIIGAAPINNYSGMAGINSGGSVTFDIGTTGGASSYTGLIAPSTVVQGGGTITLSANNSFASTLTVSAGTLILSGSNSTTGNATIASGATLQIGAGGTTGSLASAAIGSNGTLIFNRSDAFTVTSAIGGTTNVKQNGSGTTTLAAAVSSFGNLRVAAGTLVLTGSNAASTGIIDTGATLQIGAGSTAGSFSTNNVANNGTLVFNRSNALTMNWVGGISGTGNISQIGSGTTTLVNDATYSGTIGVTAGTLILEGNNSTTATATIASGATLQIGNGGGFGSVNSTSIVNNGTLTFNRWDSVTVAAVISGTGNISQIGVGATTLSGDNTYSGTIGVTAGTLVLTGSNSTTATATIASGAILQIGDGGTTGSLASASIANDGTVVFNRSDALTVASVISGVGNVSQDGSGTTTLSADNTVSGTVGVNAGALILTGANASVSGATVAAGATLQIGDGGTTGTLGAASLANDGTFIINRSANTTLAANVTGAGTMSATITGTLTLNGTIGQAGLDLAGSTGVTIGGAVTTNGDISVASTAGAVVLNAGMTSTAGNILIQAAQFTNTVGAGALSATGVGQTWQVWSTNSDPFNANPVIGDTPNGLAFDFIQYNATFGVANVLGTGNGLFYSLAPSVSASLTGTVTKPYDGNDTAPITSANVSITGLINGDVVSNSVSGATYAGPDAGTSLVVSWPSSGMTALTSVATGSKPIYGYDFTGGTVSGAIGSITKVAVTVTANSPTLLFNGQTQSLAATDFTATGLVNGETKAVLTGVTASGSGQAIGTYVTSVSGTATNYDLTFVDGVLTITKAALNPGGYDQFIFETMKRMKKALPIDELTISTVCEVSIVAPANLSRKSC